MQKHAAERNQNHCTDERHDDADDVDPVYGVWHSEESTGEIPAHQSADNTENDITDETVAAPTHHLPGEPAGN